MSIKPFFSPTKSGLKHGKILGVNIASTSDGQVLRFFRSRIAARERFYVVTPNPEIIVEAQNDPDLKKALNSAAISLPDGVGISFAWRFLGFQGKLSTIKGREMFLELMKLANQKGWKVFFLGDYTVGRAKEILSSGLKRVKIEAMEGPWLNKDASPKSQEDRVKEASCIAKINEFMPQILFVGFNASKQEKWVYKWYKRLNIGSAMVVGGTFDYFAQKTLLPPKWMEQAGLEWLWRLIRQPWRIGRIFRATVIFPIMVFWYKLSAS